MSDLTIDEKARCAEHRAREQTAEKHFYDQNQPFYPMGFSIYNRNPGHWDIAAQRAPGKVEAWQYANPNGQTSDKEGARERAFRIRGDPGDVVVFDERWNPHRKPGDGTMRFRSVMAAMVWICEELMVEPSNTKEANG